MTGPGHVDPGGPPLEIQLSPTVTCRKLSVGRMDNNAYLLTSAAAGLLIDAADEDDRLLDLIGNRRLDTIVTTHRHGDHWQALPALAAATSAALVCGQPDAAAIAEGTGVEGLRGVWDGDVVDFDPPLEVIGLVGHTPGSITLAWSGARGPVHLFTGDSLFPGGPGRTSSRRDFDALLGDLETKIFARFPDETAVHPGHGDDTTLGAERPHLDEWRTRGW